MRIDELLIANFKAIRYLRLSSLENMVVIAGANGSGKSCVFDAIRLLKATHGGYANVNEYTRFFQEFHIDFQKREERARIMNDKNSRLSIAARFACQTRRFCTSKATHIS